MGLLNIYQIRSMRPHINYRFKCDIWEYAGTFLNIDEVNCFSFAVKKVKLPTFKLDTENKISFGNTAYVIPTINFGETSLEITFEEDDRMNIYYKLCDYFGNRLFDSAKMKLICVKITQYNETMVTPVDSKIYLCRMKDFSQPAFNNNGRGAPVEITASFAVVYIYQGDAADAGFNISSNNIIERPPENDEFYRTTMQEDAIKADKRYEDAYVAQEQKILNQLQKEYSQYKNKAVTNLHKETLKKEKEKFAAANKALKEYTSTLFSKIKNYNGDDKNLLDIKARVYSLTTSAPGQNISNNAFELLASDVDVDISDGIDTSEKNSLMDFYGLFTDDPEQLKLLSQAIDLYSDAKINTNILSEAEPGKEEAALKTVFENNDQSYDNELLRAEMNLAISDDKRAAKNSSSDPEWSLRAKSPKTQAIQDAEREMAAATGVSYLAIAMANGGEAALYGKGFEERKVISESEKAEAQRIQGELDKLPYGNLLQEFVADLSEKQYWYGHKTKNGDLGSVEGLDCSAAMSAWATQVGYTIDQRDASAKSGGLVRQLVAQGAEDVGKNYDTGLVPGDILNKSSTKEGNSGHVVMFLGYDNNGNMLVAESSGKTGEDKATDEWISSGGRVRKVSIQKMKDEGYIGVKIMNNPNIKHNF